MKLTSTQYNDLLSRANALGPEAVSKFAQMAAKDKSEDEIFRMLSDLAFGKTGGTTFRNLKDMPDEVFIRGLTNPDVHKID